MSPAEHSKARGDLKGVDAVFRDIFDAAGPLTGGSTRRWREDVLANDERVVVTGPWRDASWRSTPYDGRLTEARFFPFDRAASGRFFE